MFPVRINQEWGRKDSFYEQFGFKQHNGADYALGEKGELRCPVPCEVTKIGWQPNGAGHYICLLTLSQYDFEDGKSAFAELTYMHLDHTIASVGQKLAPGELFAIGDNTGASTGSHTHLAPKRVKKYSGGYRTIDVNDANNTFDPEKHRDGTFAKDFARESKYFPFSKDLYLGVEDPEVKELQKFLNEQGFKVAWWGNGSPGNETTYFGNLTQKALQKFQAAKGVYPTAGFFGPLTRGYISKLY